MVKTVKEFLNLLGLKLLSKCLIIIINNSVKWETWSLLTFLVMIKQAKAFAMIILMQWNPLNNLKITASINRISPFMKDSLKKTAFINLTWTRLWTKWAFRANILRSMMLKSVCKVTRKSCKDKGNEKD